MVKNNGVQDAITAAFLYKVQQGTCRHDFLRLFKDFMDGWPPKSPSPHSSKTFPSRQ